MVTVTLPVNRIPDFLTLLEQHRTVRQRPALPTGATEELLLTILIEISP